MLNSSAMDIMYYTSPLYRDEVSALASWPFLLRFTVVTVSSRQAWPGQTYHLVLLQNTEKGQNWQGTPLVPHSGSRATW